MKFDVLISNKKHIRKLLTIFFSRGLRVICAIHLAIAYHSEAISGPKMPFFFFPVREIDFDFSYVAFPSDLAHFRDRERRSSRKRKSFSPVAVAFFTYECESNAKTWREVQRGSVKRNCRTQQHTSARRDPRKVRMLREEVSR